MKRGGLSWGVNFCAGWLWLGNIHVKSGKSLQPSWSYWRYNTKQILTPMFPYSTVDITTDTWIKTKNQEEYLSKNPMRKHGHRRWGLPYSWEKLQLILDHSLTINLIRTAQHEQPCVHLFTEQKQKKHLEPRGRLFFRSTMGKWAAADGVRSSLAALHTFHHKVRQEKLSSKPRGYTTTTLLHLPVVECKEKEKRHLLFLTGKLMSGGRATLTWQTEASDSF